MDILWHVHTNFRKEKEFEQMMRVGIDTRDLKIAKTGVRTWTIEMIRVLESQPDIRLIKLDNHMPVYTGRNFLLKIVEHIRFYWWKVVALPVLALRNQCDWVICADFFSPPVKLRFKTLLVLHDAFFWEYPEHYNPIWRFLFNIFGNHGIHHADIIITPSEYSKRRLMHYTKIDERKFHVVHEACRKFPKPSPERPFKFPYILHIGVLEKRKNLPMLVRAFQRIADRYPDLCLVLAGNSPTKKNINDTVAIKEAISQAGLTSKVYLTGHISDQMAADLFQYAEAYAFPSYNEGFGLPVLEAFSFGVPVIASDNSALPEIGGKALKLFNPNDVHSMATALENVLEDDALKEKMIKHGFEINEGYSWEKAGLRLCELMIKNK